MKINVTIGICVKNAEKTIEDTINSISNQNYNHNNMEIIIVDSNSKDKTIDIIYNFMSNTDISTKLLNDEGKGLGKARQIVIDKANGDYILWVDSDVILKNDFLENQIKFMNKNACITIAIGKCIYKSTNKSFISDINNLLFQIEGENDIITMEAAISRIKSLKKINGFDIRIKGASEDRDIFTRMILKGGLITFNEKAKYFRISPETLNDIYKKSYWYGYGNHYLNHKYSRLINLINFLPPIFLGWGIKLSYKAYKKYHKKKSFFIPLFCLLQSISWWIGYIKSHLDGYGHIFTVPEIYIKRKTSLLARARAFYLS